MDTKLPEPIRVLFVEDVATEAELAVAQLRKAGLSCTHHRVENEVDLRQALQQLDPTIILSDFSLPQFDGLSALQVAREVAPDVPFLFVSGTIGEERAIEALRRGAVDYVLKNNLARLGPAVRRALTEAQAQREKIQQRIQISRLDRVLRMLSGINALVVRARDRQELMQEACRLAVSVGGYASAIISSKLPGAPVIKPVAWSGNDIRVTERLCNAVSDSATRETSVIGRVILTGRPFVCNDTQDLEATATFTDLMKAAGFGSVVALPLLIENTAVGAMLLTARDVSAISEEELRMLRDVAGSLSFALQYLQKDTTVKFLSHFDPQTGLARRPLFSERVSRVLKEAEKRRTRHAVVIFDLERLSEINDSFGRRVGDLLLQHVADRLKRRFPNTEQIAHFTGGTYALIQDTEGRSPEQMMQATREHGAVLFGEPFIIEERPIPVSARLAFAVFPDHGKTAEALVQNAEAAMLTARSSGQHQLRYSAEKQSEMRARLALEHKLRLALERRQFELHYQPKVNVITRCIEGVEALIRWRDPEAGLISPGAFLPVLESTGLILDVGDWVIRQAAADCQEWLRQGLPPIRVSVNVTPAQLRHPDFSATFLGAMRGWANNLTGLDIEITEGVLQEDCEAEVKKLKMLRSAGIRVAIDDFGTGYSSLSRLSSMPIDTLKIDRSFVSQIPESAAGRLLVTTIITLARGFNMRTVAEGVETQQQLDFLWHAHCDQAQGFLHSKAVPNDELIRLMLHGNGNVILPPAGPSAEQILEAGGGA